MIIAPPTDDQHAGMSAPAEFRFLDSAPDPVLDGLVRSAAVATGCPIALISMVEPNRQWFKARVGIDTTELTGDTAFCAHAVLGISLFEVNDAALDTRFIDNPLVLGEPRIRFYAGMPLCVDGHPIGALCVIDQQPRHLDRSQRQLLIDLARAAEHWMKAWRDQRRLREWSEGCASERSAPSQPAPLGPLNKAVRTDTL